MSLSVQAPANKLDAQFQEFEQNVYLPLASNSYFQHFKRNITDPTFRTKYLTLGVHRILRDLQNQSINSRADQLEILQVIVQLSESHKYAYDLAVTGTFLQEGYLVIRNNISLCQKDRLLKHKRDSRGDFEIKKYSKKYFDDETYVLEPIPDEDIPFLKNWIRVVNNFLQDKKIAEFSILGNYLFFEYALSFLTKCDSPLFKMHHTLKEEFKNLFYSMLDACFEHTKLCDFFLQDTMLTHWFLQLIDNCRNAQDYTRTYRFLGKLARSEKLTTKVADIDILSKYVWTPMVKIVFENERNSWEISYFKQQENLQDLIRTVSLIFSTLTSKESNLSSLLGSLQTFHTDALFRFYVYCVESRDHLSASQMGFSLLTLIRSERYQLPSFCSKLGAYIISKISGKDDYLLLLTLRLLKYIQLDDQEKTSIFTSLMTSNKSPPTPLNQIDDLIFRKNHPDPDDNEEEQKIKHRKSPSSSLSKPVKNPLDISKILGEFQPSSNFNKQKKATDLSNPEFNFKLKDSPNHKYPFLNGLGEGFNFIQHCEGLCPLCSSIKGLFSYSETEFINYAKSELQKNGGIVTIPEDGDVSMSIVQFLFECTFDDESSSLLSVAFPFCANLLLTQEVPFKYKFPILLYLVHIILNYENGVDVLYNASFLLFAVNFINNFMVAFDQESFKKWMNPKVFKLLGTGNREAIAPQPIEDQEPSGIFTKVLRNRNHPTQKVPTNILSTLPGTELQIQEITLNPMNNLIWDKQTNSFTYDSGTPEDDDGYYDPDAITDYGKYTKYFWKLHFMHHCSKVVLEMIRKTPKTYSPLLETQLGDFIEQIREIIIIFFKYTEKYIPSHPFHVDTECWNETKDLIFETLGTILEIQYALISTFPKFANDFFKLIQGKSEIVQIYIKMVGKFPTLAGSIALVSSLSLFYSYEAKVSPILQNIEHEANAFYSELFVNLSREFQRLEGGLGSTFNAKNDTSSLQAKKKNRNIIINALQFSINTFNVLNRLAIKKRFSIKQVQDKFIETFFKSLVGVLKSITKYCTAIFASKSLDSQLQESSSSDLENLFHKLFLNAGLFLWTYSDDTTTTLALVKSEILTFCFKELINLNLNENIIFSFMVLGYNLLRNSDDLYLITKFNKGFIQALLNFLNESNFRQRLYMIPILRGLKILLLKSPQDRSSFGELKPVLLEILDKKLTPLDSSQQAEKIELENFFANNYTQLIKLADKMAYHADESLRKNDGFETQQYNLIKNPHSFINSKIEDRNLTKFLKNRDQPKLLLLKQEAHELLNLMMGRSIDSQKGQNDFFSARKEVTEGAGLISNHAVKIMYETQKKLEMIKNQTQAHGLLDVSALNISKSSPLFKKNALDSLQVGVASFNASRELANLPYRYGQPGSVKGNQYSPFMISDSQNLIQNISQVSLSSNISHKSPTLHKKSNSKGIEPHLLRLNAQNILRSVDSEYEKILRSERARDLL